MIIPLLGKFIPKTLMDSIYKRGVKEIKILLDKDVQSHFYYVNYFMNNGITVTNILPTEKDTGEMGFSEVNKKLKNTKQTDFEDMVSQKLKGVMIYILDKPYNQGLYEQWIDVINRSTNIPYELLVQNRQDVEFESFMSSQLFR